MQFTNNINNLISAGTPTGRTCCGNQSCNKPRRGEISVEQSDYNFLARQREYSQI
jgi:hypothetical protein